MTKKICFAASSGGHFEQLMMLKPLMDEYNSFIVTEKTGYKINTGSIKVNYVLQVNREEKTFIFKLVVNFFKEIRIYIQEKPDVIICTGVLAVLPLCLIFKMFGKKVVYIESFAKINSPTKTGQLIYKFADRFYVQWPEMKKIYPKSIYIGGIY